MDSQHAALYDLSRSLTPLSSVADSNDEVDRLLAVSTSPARSLVKDNVDEESDLSPLTSSDEEGEDVDRTPRPLRSQRTLRPRVAKVLTPTAKHVTTGPATISLPSPPATVDQLPRISRKRKHTESVTAQPTSTTQEQDYKPGQYVSEDRCHQCRNRPRYAFMRCTAKGASGNPCRKLFCASCVIKRYPGIIDFNPQVKKWKCPFCRDSCDCTKCCFKRNVPYTSTSGVKIELDILLYHAALMPGNSNSEKPPHPPKSLKLTHKNSKSLQKPNSRPTRDPVTAKTGKARKAGPNLAGGRDIEYIIRGLADTAAMFEKFGCVSGEYWGVVFSHIDGGRIGVAYVGDQLPDIFIRRDEGNDDPLEIPSTPPTKRRRISSGLSA